MLSVITQGGGDLREVSAFLADLVPGAVNGLIRDVLVLDGEGDGRALGALCQEAGAEKVTGGLGVAVRKARSDLLLLASPRLRLDGFALDRLGRELADRGAGEMAAGLALTGPAILRFWSPGPPPGLVSTRARLLSLGPGVGLETALGRISRRAPRLRIAG